MKIIIFRGDQNDISAKKTSLAVHFAFVCSSCFAVVLYFILVHLVFCVRMFFQMCAAHVFGP